MIIKKGIKNPFKYFEPTECDIGNIIIWFDCLLLSTNMMIFFYYISTVTLYVPVLMCTMSQTEKKMKR